MLAELLEREYQGVQQLKILLEQEHRFLRNRKIDRLQELLPQKHQVVEQIRQVVASRERFLQQAGYPATAAGLKHFIEQSNDRAAQRCWHKLIPLATEAATLNQQNGSLIAASRDALDAALAVLKGCDPRPTHYDQAARTHHTSSQTPIARA